MNEINNEFREDPPPATDTAGKGNNSTSDKGISAMRLKRFIERVERLEEERKNLGTDLKEVYSEAKGGGFDTKIIRQVVRIRKMDKQDRQEQEAILALYLDAIGEN